MEHTINTAEGEDELILTRRFQAPRELVYKAWTEPERLAKWWGPKGMLLKVERMDLRPGGEFLYSISTPNGQTMYGKFVYSVIVPPERLDFINSFTEATGAIIRNPMSAGWPLEIQNTLLLAEEGTATVLTLRGGPIRCTAEERATFLRHRPDMEKGFSGTWGQLDSYLQSIQ